MRYLGIDYGLKKIGLAIGDDETGIASPAEVLRFAQEVSVAEVISKLKEVIVADGVDAVVIGMPKATGSHHSDEQLNTVQAFADKLRDKIDQPVYEVDERFTSVESQRIQDETGTDVSEDALAAMLILQEYLDNKGK